MRGHAREGKKGAWEASPNGITTCFLEYLHLSSGQRKYIEAPTMGVARSTATTNYSTI